MRVQARVVVFCDLDSLLAPVSPFAGRARGRAGGLDHLEHAGVALVFCSRRTRAEIDWLLQQLRVEAPIVAEHGAAVFVPAGYFDEVPGSRPLAGYDVVEFGRSYTSVVEVLRRTAARLDVPIRAMSDMSIEEASQILSVPLLLGRLAKLREYTELFRVDHANRARLFKALRSVHLHCTEGEYFDYAGATVDASLGVALLRTLYRRSADAVSSIGIADASSEPDLLRLVDYPVTVSAAAAGMLAFPAPMIEHSARLRSTGATALVDMVNDIVAAVRRVGAEASMLVNERFIPMIPGGGHA